MEEIKISVVTVTFNAVARLSALIDTLRAQTDRNFEWVVVDGGSTDGTVDLIKGADDVVGKWVSEPDFGIYHAINKALSMASGDYYLVVGSDDRLHPHAIRRYREVIAESAADIITACIKVDESIVKPGRRPAWLHAQAAYVSGHSVGALIRTRLHSRFGYYSRRFPIAADQYFLKKALGGGASLAVSDFVAGEYSSQGLSGVDVLGTLCEIYRVQMETEKSPLLQTLIFMLRLLKNFPTIVTRVRRTGEA